MRFDTPHYALDVVEKAEAFVQSGRFTDLDRHCVHQRFLELAKAGGETSEAMLQHIHDRQLNHFGATAVSAEEFERQREAFEQKVWPVIRPLLQRNPGTAQFMLEHGVDSQFVAQFLYDVQKNQGVSILLGHGIGHTVTDELVEVPPSDNAFAFYHDASFGIFRFRAKLAQEELERTDPDPDDSGEEPKRILFLGGGADPTLYARRIRLCPISQQVVVYDNDPKMRDYLETIMGPLPAAGIDYRIGNIDDVLQDESQFGQYDLICLLGVAAYYAKRPQFLFDGICDLLKPGGRVIFDVQSLHPVLAFDVYVLGWPTTLHVEPSIEKAIEVSRLNCENAGLHVLWSRAEEVVASVEIPAGVVTLAEKPGSYLQEPENIEDL